MRSPRWARVCLTTGSLLMVGAACGMVVVRAAAG